MSGSSSSNYGAGSSSSNPPKNEEEDEQSNNGDGGSMGCEREAEGEGASLIGWGEMPVSLRGNGGVKRDQWWPE